MTLSRETASFADFETGLGGRASALVNPASGLANDYLNLFNEAVMLIEQLPSMPELMDDLLLWTPISYQDYFARSPLPGRINAMDAYALLEPSFRRQFEEIVAELDRMTTGAVAALRRHHRVKGDTDMESLATSCERFGGHIRAVLSRAADLINGENSSLESAQKRADRLMAVRRHMTRPAASLSPAGAARA
jgi:hypothetical protein